MNYRELDCTFVSITYNYLPLNFTIMTNLWRSGTQKAFHGYMANLAISVLGSIVLWVLEPNAIEILLGQIEGYLVASIIFAIAGAAALVYYILGLNEMKKAAEGTNLADATQRLFIGAILAVVGSILCGFLATAIIGGLLGLAGFIVAWTGYSLIKNNATDANAKFGGEKLALSALITAIAFVAGLLPVVGSIFALCLEIWALYVALQGWKALAASEIK